MDITGHCEFDLPEACCRDPYQKFQLCVSTNRFYQFAAGEQVNQCAVDRGMHEDSIILPSGG